MTIGDDGLPTDDAVIRQWLGDVTTALHELTTGEKARVVTYGQGIGTKSVSYAATNIGALQAYKMKLQKRLGIKAGFRRPMRMRF